MSNSSDELFATAKTTRHRHKQWIILINKPSDNSVHCTNDSRTMFILFSKIVFVLHNFTFPFYFYIMFFLCVFMHFSEYHNTILLCHSIKTQTLFQKYKWKNKIINSSTGKELRLKHIIWVQMYWWWERKNITNNNTQYRLCTLVIHIKYFFTHFLKRT